jgi:hypothetical protein
MTNDRLNELGGYLEKLAAVEGGEQEAIQRLNSLNARYQALAPEGADSENLRNELREVQGQVNQIAASRERPSNLYATLMKESDLIGDLSGKKLIENTYKVSPTFIEGDEEHNKIAKKHSKALKAERIANSPDSDNRELADLAFRGLIAEAEGIAKKMYSEENDPYIEKNTRENLQAIMPELIAKNRLAEIGHDKDQLRAYASEGAKALKKEFEKSLADEGARKNYTATNLREGYAQADKKKGEIRHRMMAEAAKQFNAVYRS